MAVDGGIFKKKLKDKFIGAGLFIFQDIAGDSRLSTTQVNLSISSVITINKTHNISAGIQGGFAQKKIDAEGLRWGTQYDGGGYASQISSGESDVFENYSFGDFSMGLSWSHGTSSTNISSNNHLKANAGVALFHINTPKQGMNQDKLHREFIAHAGLNVGLKGTSLSLLPSLLYLQQGPLYEINAGAMLRHTIKEESKYTGIMKEIAVLVGGFYRVGDAFIPTFMFEIANFSLGVSYDVNVSPLSEATNSAGGFEISFRYLTPNPFKYGKGTKYTPML
jgi:type IX secretion system PorP/SprF family membrane protein